MLKKTRTRLIITLLVAVAMLGIAYLALRPHEPVYEGKRLSVWIEELSKPQSEDETLSQVQARWQTLSNVVRTIGPRSLPCVIQWIRNRPRPTVSDTVQYRVEEAFHGRFSFPSRKDRSSDAMLIFQLLGSEAAPAIPQLSQLLSDDYTTIQAAYCLSMIGPDAVPALSNAVVNGTALARSGAIDGLAELGYSASTTAPLLAGNVQTNNPNAWRALRALAEVQTNTTELLAIALRCLPDTNTAPGAAYALARIGPEGLPVLLKSLVSSQAVIRASSKAALEPRFQDLLAGKRPGNFYVRAGCYQARFGLQMTEEATAKTLGHFQDSYYKDLTSISQQYLSSTNASVRSAANKVMDFVHNVKPPQQ